METRPVSRCIAIAAHGKRCQQSPFRGSPYCWHHNQSRKVWPPSRPANTAGRVVPPTDADDAATRQAREASRQQSGEVVSRRLMEVLDDEALETLVAFLETEHDATAVLAREDGRMAVAVEATERRQHASR